MNHDDNPVAHHLGDMAALAGAYTRHGSHTRYDLTDRVVEIHYAADGSVVGAVIRRPAAIVRGAPTSVARDMLAALDAAVAAGTITPPPTNQPMEEPDA